jgi:hypothetical protein
MSVPWSAVVPGVSDPRKQVRGRSLVLRRLGTGFLCGWLNVTRCDALAGTVLWFNGLREVFEGLRAIAGVQIVCLRRCDLDGRIMLASL